MEGQLTKDDDYKNWIKWLEAKENEWITSFVFNPILSIQALKFGNSFNSFGVSLNGNRWNLFQDLVQSRVDKVVEPWIFKSLTRVSRYFLFGIKGN